jgi:alanine racemase
MELAKWHRDFYNIPVIGIAGSHGKTIVKEWLGLLLNEKFTVVKSPKSYNSKLGLALSILELHEEAEVGVFEVSLTDPGEGDLFRELLKPTIVGLTSILKKPIGSINAKKALLDEYARFCSESKYVFYTSGSGFESIQHDNHVALELNKFKGQFEFLNFSQDVKKANATLCLGISDFMGVQASMRKDFFPDLAMRLESYDGIDNSFIINDTYGLDLDSLETSLQYQLSVAQGKRKIVLLPKAGSMDESGTVKVLNRYQPDAFYFIESIDDINFSLNNAVVLVKGGKESFMNKIAGQLKLKRHRTKIEVNLTAIRKNLHLIKSRLEDHTKCLVMVKANAYGSGLIKVGQYIEQLGADYLGVAYTDEGVALRKSGVKCPILVMSAGADDFQDCIDFSLEPSVYSLQILDELVKTLIANKKVAFPIHLKVDTGMKRLGVNASQVPQFIEVLKSQPELSLSGIYSHFAESDNTENTSFTNQQIRIFYEVCESIKKRVSEPFIRHISNSAGVYNFPSSQMDMVRLGLVVFGTASDHSLAEDLIPAIKWSSQISQIKEVEIGDSVGYGRSFIAEKRMKIAIVPVGYADGFRRSLGNGKGFVFIHGHSCPTVGHVCMDMVMIDVSNLNIQVGDAVEIIGDNQSLLDFSNLLGTIPYEILTGLSSRVHRNYVVH